MNNMAEFYLSNLATGDILAAAAEFKATRFLWENQEYTGKDELPDVIRTTTTLRDALEQIANPPAIVSAYIGMLDSEVRMFISIRKSLRKPT